jgi:hypothetical protein
MFEDLSNVVLTCRYCRQLVKLCIDRICVNAGESGFSRAGGAPEQKGKNVALFDREAKGFARADQMLLADKLVQSVRPDPAREWFHLLY